MPFTSETARAFTFHEVSHTSLASPQYYSGAREPCHPQRFVVLQERISDCVVFPLEMWVNVAVSTIIADGAPFTWVMDFKWSASGYGGWMRILNTLQGSDTGFCEHRTAHLCCSRAANNPPGPCLCWRPLLKSHHYKCGLFLLRRRWLWQRQLLADSPVPVLRQRLCPAQQLRQAGLSPTEWVYQYSCLQRPRCAGRG